MGSDKTYIFDGGGSGGGLDIAALVSSMMGNKGMDPNLVAALMNGNNNRGAWGGDGCWWIWIILLFFCWGGFGGNGFGGNNANGLPAQLNGDAGRELLMNAIQGNGAAINQLASLLNCSTQQIQNAVQHPGHPRHVKPADHQRCTVDGMPNRQPDRRVLLRYEAGHQWRQCGHGARIQ